MPISKSEGVTPTERLLAALCERSFLRLWSYPNPFKEDGDELCDVIAVFENNAFVLFDREGRHFCNSDRDPYLNWARWKKKVVDAQIRTANGAERYIKSGRPIFLDPKRQVPFPLGFDGAVATIHKIIVAHGAKDACKNFSDQNVYGSLGICYADNAGSLKAPFILDLDRNNPVHVFDSHNLEIILSELDTIFDFTTYMNAKREAIKRYKGLSYCGEEDLLAHYYLNFDGHANEHFIGSRSREFDFVTIGEGEWKDFVSSDVYARKQIANRTSYLWDDIIQRTCQNALDGTLLGDGGIFQGKSAIQEMAKEPRFSRRALSDNMIRAIRAFPDTPDPIMRNLSFMPSFFEGTGYVFLQLKVDDIGDYETDYRPKRRALLELACGVAKNKFEHLKKVVGIAIDAPKFSKGNSEDFLLLECSEWPDSTRRHYEEANEGLNFFNTPSMKSRLMKISEFPPAHTARKVGRNALCPCGSGKKFKKCCRDQVDRLNS